MGEPTISLEPAKPDVILTGESKQVVVDGLVGLVGLLGRVASASADGAASTAGAASTNDAASSRRGLLGLES